MIIKSIIGLEDIVVPDSARVEFSHDGKELKIFCTHKEKEFLYVQEHIIFDDTVKTRKYFNHKGQIHRPEEDGPAMVSTRNGITMLDYFKNGKHHRINGGAFFTATGHWIYYINGVKLSKEAHAKIVANGGKIQKIKYDLNILKESAADLSKVVLNTKTISGHVLTDDDLKEIQLATKSKNWSKMTSENYGAKIEVILNCKPLDDTLRCYLIIDQNGDITQKRLEIE